MNRQRVRGGAEYFAAGAVIEADLHIVVDLVDAPKPQRAPVQHECARTARRERLQQRRRRAAERGAVGGVELAKHAHAHDDTRLPELV